MTEGFFKAIVRNCSDIISILDQDCNYLFVSDSVTDILGYTPEELLEKSFFTHFHPDFEIFGRNILQSVLKGGQASHVQMKFISKSGEERWMEATITNMLDDRQVKGIVINSRDVTEKVNSELLRQKTQFLYKSLFDNHPDAVFSLSAAGNFLTVNEGALKLFEYSKKEMINQNFCSFVERDNIEIAKSSFSKALTGKFQSGDIKIVTKTGIIKELSVTLYPVEASGNLEGVHGIAKDNTLLKRADKLAEEHSKRLNRT